MDNPIDKVIARKTAIDKAKKEIKRRRRISKRTKGIVIHSDRKDS